MTPSSEWRAHRLGSQFWKTAPLSGDRRVSMSLAITLSHDKSSKYADGMRFAKLYVADEASQIGRHK
jgi:hypothetical protein